MTRSQVSIPSLPRSLTALETWGFGFSGLLLWLGTAPAIHFALGANALEVWLPGTLIGILLNLQVKRLGRYFPDVAGGTANYTTRLLQSFPSLARYSAIGYLLGWVSVPAVNAIILTDLIQENLDPLGLTCPIMVFRIGFVILPFVVASGGTRTLGILQAFFVFPAIGLLTTFCLQGLGWLSFASDSPGLMPDTWTSITAIDWMKWFFISTYAAYSCETASSFVSESRQPVITLRCLSVTAGFIPIVYLAGSWVLTRLGPTPGAETSAYFSLVTAASPFWGTFAPALITFLMTSGCLLSSTTAVSNCPRILYQLAIDGYLPPVFSVISRRGIPTPSLVFTLCLSLLCFSLGNVAQIVMMTGTGWLLAIMAIHFGLWLGRKQPETRWPWLSLGFFMIEGVVLVVGGSLWGWQALFIGMLLPFVISSISTFLPNLGFAPFHSSWWQQRNQEPTDRLKADWIIFQVVVLLGLICGAVSIGWFIRARLDHYGPENQLALFSILLITVAFIGVAIACWTSLSQITIITETQEKVEQTLDELQQQTQQAQHELRQRQQAEALLQQLNQELEQRVQERTQQFQQEAALRQQAEIKFQTIFHVSPHAIAITSLSDRRIVEINEAFCQLFGYSRDEMVGHYADEFTLFANPIDQGIVQRQLMKNGTVRNLECVYRTKTEEVRTGIASAEFIDVDGTPCFMTVANDITDRKQAEAALAQSEARFQKIAAASPAQIYILVTDRTGTLIRFEYVSPSVWELRELSPEQLLQDPSPVYDQIHPDDRAGYHAARDRSLTTMEPFLHEYRIVPSPDRVKWVRVNSRPERQENDEIFWYGIILDVSDRKQIEQQLRTSLKEKEVLLREVYHRVKNNMQLVSSLLSLQADTVSDPAILRLLNESQQRVKTMALIHERLYHAENLAQINTGTYIQDLVNNLMLFHKTTDSRIQVNLNIAELELNLDVAVPCSLIINELVSNALKYAFPDKKGEIQLQFWLDNTGDYYLSVKDNGIGFPPNIEPHKTETLGMQLVYGLTEQLGGTIKLDRREGSQFKITFRKRS